MVASIHARWSWWSAGAALHKSVSQQLVKVEPVRVSLHRAPHVRSTELHSPGRDITVFCKEKVEKRIQKNAVFMIKGVDHALG